MQHNLKYWWATACSIIWLVRSPGQSTMETGVREVEEHSRGRRPEGAAAAE